MPVSGSSVLTWSLWALTGAVETGSRLLARVGAGSGGGGRPAEQRLAEVAGAVVSSSAPQQPPSTPTVAGRAGRTVATSKAQGQRAVPGRAATASVTPATVRSWAREQGIQVSDRGRIPRLVMEQYLAEVVRAAAGSRGPSRASSKGPRSPSGRSRSSAA